MMKRGGSKAGLTVLAAGAHPDDIEFMMAGTLIRLHQAGAAIHMWNLANGNCGTATHSRFEILRLRRAEARRSAALIGATMHPPLVDDIMIHYEPTLLARVAAVVRRVKPDLLLVPSPHDYMEDHQNTSRLLVTAAFVRGMTGFTTRPAVPPWAGDMTLYHALPYGLRDGMRRVVHPGEFVDIGSVLAVKRRMLAQHRTQKEWLDVSQGLDAYLTTMEDMSREVGRLSRRFEFAEGWRRHLHLGFSAGDTDPLRTILGKTCLVNARYEASLEH